MTPIVDPDRLFLLCPSCLLPFDSPPRFLHRIAHYLFLLPVTFLCCLYLPHVYIELLEPALIDRVLLLSCPVQHQCTEKLFRSSSSHRFRPEFRRGFPSIAERAQATPQQDNRSQSCDPPHGCLLGYSGVGDSNRSPLSTA